MIYASAHVGHCSAKFRVDLKFCVASADGARSAPSKTKVINFAVIFCLLFYQEKSKAVGRQKIK